MQGSNYFNNDYKRLVEWFNIPRINNFDLLNFIKNSDLLNCK